LPDEDVSVLGSYLDKDGTRETVLVCIFLIREGKPWLDKTSDYTMSYTWEEITHWMPLPEYKVNG